ncbi:MAG: transketolase C-terminal domain-containing protein [bacterium]
MVNKLITEDTKLFMTGNEVIAYAAIAAGAEFMYGYPITPQNEIMHTWCKLLPKTEAGFLQTEDEISAGFSTIGGILVGKKAFTATAGPGNVIMQDAMSMAEMMRIPFVCAVMQRGGPSTATVIYAQQETQLTAFGGNGEGFRIVYSTAGHQDLYDYTIKAFNTAWKYRFPTYVLADGYQGKMREPLIAYDPESKGIELTPATPYLRGKGTAGTDRKPVHLRNTYNLEEELMEVLDSYNEEFNRITPEIAEYKEFYADDAEILIIAHGIVARSAMTAIEELRDKNIKAGLFRPVTIRPLAAEPLRKAASKAKMILFTESANGQMARMVLEKLYGITTPYQTLYKMGVGVTGGDIVQKVEQMINENNLVVKK